MTCSRDSPSRRARRGGWGGAADEFQRQYGAKAQVFVYRSDRLADIRNFADGSGLQVMVMNYQAFAARGEAARRISMEFDGFGSLKPLDVIAKTNPILILDEPQKMEGRVTQGMFPKFNPLFILKYSATHKTIEHLVYRLDAIDAFEKKLVKRIAPVCLEVKNKMGGDDFIYCSTVRPGNPAPEAVLEFNMKSSGGDEAHQGNGDGDSQGDSQGHFRAIRQQPREVHRRGVAHDSERACGDGDRTRVLRGTWGRPAV